MRVKKALSSLFALISAAAVCRRDCPRVKRRSSAAARPYTSGCRVALNRKPPSSSIQCRGRGESIVRRVLVGWTDHRRAGQSVCVRRVCSHSMKRVGGADCLRLSARDVTHASMRCVTCVRSEDGIRIRLYCLHT
eukprot:1075100-Prymnesium_polylepis.1